MKKLSIEEKAKRWETYQAKFKEYAKRRQARLLLLAKKAQAAGIVVSDQEIDDYLKR